ncbi:exported hypothetical protein [Candidatus Sulfopaludibacter sp. SbA4]|nr:exported hypothetical protein [Candidatus Sulfopaludibacter sp. SbA4]
MPGYKPGVDRPPGLSGVWLLLASFFVACLTPRALASLTSLLL